MIALFISVALIVLPGCAWTNGQEAADAFDLSASRPADEAITSLTPFSRAAANDESVTDSAVSPSPTAITPAPVDEIPGSDLADTTDSTDWSQFWPSILATAVGALLALLAAMWVERRVAHAEARRVHKQDQDRRREIKIAMTRDLELNDEILVQIHNTLRVPQTAFDVPTLDSWRALHVETIRFFTTANLAPIYLSLERIARLVDLYATNSRGSLETALSARMNTLPELEDIIASTRVQITDALSALADERVQ